MSKAKKQLLETTYQQFMAEGLGQSNLELLKDIVDDKVMGFGSTIDEKIFSLSDFHDLLMRQKEQSHGIDLRWEIKPLHRHIAADENTAIFADDLFLYVTIDTEQIEMYLRFSVVLEYKHNKWFVVHWHGSKPENVQSEEDTFGIENWRQKAEALEKLVKERTADLVDKNRELEIETSLERVRTVAMSMHKPDDLLNICRVFFEELVRLGFNNIRNALIHIFNDEQGYYYDYDYSDVTGGKITHLPYKGNAAMENFLEKIRKSDDAFVEVVFEGKDMKEWKKFRKKSGQIDDKRLNAATQLNYYFYSIGAGNIGFSNFGKIENGQLEILKRFRNVFDFSYRRYMDIEKAEAQSREAQIELALERVRARTMAMQQSNELQDTAILLFQQMKALGVQTGSCGFNIWDKNKKTTTVWMCSPEGGLQTPFKLPHTESAIYKSVYDAMNKGEEFLIEEVSGKPLKNHFDYLLTLPGIGDVIKKLRDSGYAFPERMVYHFAFFNNGYLSFHTHEPYTEAHDIFKRFAKVFEQTYTRFLDLQKAEAQANEAQIEAALERVRSRTMGMQKSEELKDIIRVVHEQILHLNTLVEHAGFIMDYKARDDMHIWLADRHDIPTEITVPYFDSPHWNSFIEAKEKGLDFFANNLLFEEKNRFYKGLFKLFSGVPEEAKQYYFSAPGLAISTVLLENVGLYIENFKGVPYTDEENNTLMRFGKVFQQTYTRFLDLQKAEAQAREAQIEVALERVRSRTMAMQHSDELLDAATLLFEQIKLLGASTWNCSFNIWTEDKKQAIAWNGTKDGFGRPFNTPNSENVFFDFYNASQRADELYVKEMGGKELELHYDYLSTLPGVGITLAEFREAGIALPTFQVFNIAYFTQGYLMFITYNLVPEFAEIFKRFAKVFEQTYTRFLDLQKAEAQAKEAQIEAALERVRSRTLAMQKSDELAETSAVLFKQLINLGIEPNRLYITIIKDESGEAEFWITDEDGSKISFAYAANLNDNASFRKMFNGWLQQKKSLTIDMQGKELQNYFQHLTDLNVSFKGGLLQKRRIQHMAYFGKGFIGMASTDQQPAESILLLERFAAVFNLTYTRFNDLKIAEAHAVQAEEDLIKLQTEKKRAEDALAELQITQRQLIQSEKMASLGELTAGIAHEIQNPLNFVNNFSEVSKELLDEMKAALESGDEEEAKGLAADIIQNLEKITHHGKRADAIVKGMLQHSRSSGNQKEPTDINTLADEYLRLAYHGLRAKDNSFNVNLKTDYDERIGNINIIPQDIGRVILNLITNAFYTVAEKKKGLPAFEPMVSVSTKKTGDKVEVIVSDNGNGIPESVADKIFQPFFTTKPTGQGTGLGLSLAYDIVKSHGGELKVGKSSSEGTVFIVSLPASQ